MSQSPFTNSSRDLDPRFSSSLLGTVFTITPYAMAEPLASNLSGISPFLIFSLSPPNS